MLKKPCTASLPAASALNWSGTGFPTAPELLAAFKEQQLPLCLTMSNYVHS